MKPVVILAALLLASCGGRQAQPVIQTVTVDVPTPISCVPKDYTPPPPSTVTAAALLAVPDAAARYQLLAEAWTLSQPIMALQAGVIAACQGAGRGPVAAAGKAASDHP